MEIAPQQFGPVLGHDAAKQDWLDAVESGRLHHGWLLRGPRGIGKARLALQFAAHLLGERTDPPLQATPDSHVGRLIIAGSHPDLRVIRRPVDDKGKEKQDIPVDSVRELAQFFSLRPAMGGWRVAIIDAVDELNRFGANAILKTLEEPPPRAVLIIVNHGEQAVLPTIRSRCRVLRLEPLDDAQTLKALENTGLDAGQAARVAKASPGRPGRAATLDSPEAFAAAEAVRNALRQLGQMDARTLQSVLQQGAKSDAALTAAMETLRTSLQKRAAREEDPVLAGDWAAAALDVMRIEGESRGLNMDRAQTLAVALERAGRLAPRSANTGAR